MIPILLVFLGLTFEPTARHLADPGLALNEAKSAAKAGDFVEALELHKWYHQNALRLDRSQVGVRSSFALAQWIQLGEKYPQALEELRVQRDRSQAAAVRKKGTRDDVIDVVSISFSLADSEGAARFCGLLEAATSQYAKACSKRLEALEKIYKNSNR